jgi:hypothetical protein
MDEEGEKGMELAGQIDLSLAIYDDIDYRCGFRPSKKSGKDRARQIEAGHTSPIIDGYRQFGLIWII